MTAFLLPLGVLLDLLIGDPPRRTHPVRLMGGLIAALERLLWRPGTGVLLRLRGALAAFLALAAPLAVAYALLRGAALYGPLQVALSLWWIASALAARSLSEHAAAVERLLSQGDLPAARVAVGRFVGRDTADLQPPEVARAAVESVAENSADGVLCPLFYIALGLALPPRGLPPVAGAALYALGYKAVSTLDSMLGYRSPRYRDFGWAAARLDDAVNYLPARVAALWTLLATPLCGLPAEEALRVLRRDGRRHPSPNSGLLEATYAGALGVRLGGPSRYGGAWHEKPYLGDGPRAAGPATIHAARRLLHAATAVGSVGYAAAVWAVLR